jgi:hypothetical protein
MRAITRWSSSLTIFLEDGVPHGLRTVGNASWKVHAIACPRTRFRELKTSEEFARPGVYVLSSPYKGGAIPPIIYVGEGDQTLPRLEQHFRQKDFWTSLVVFTAKDQLNKAHVKYLESRLVSMARAARRCIVNNNNDPRLPTLANGDTAAMEMFLKEMLRICDQLNLTVFEGPPSLPQDVPPPPRKLRGVE